MNRAYSGVIFQLSSLLNRLDIAACVCPLSARAARERTTFRAADKVCSFVEPAEMSALHCICAP